MWCMLAWALAHGLRWMSSYPPSRTQGSNECEFGAALTLVDLCVSLRGCLDPCKARVEWWMLHLDHALPICLCASIGANLIPNPRPHCTPAPWPPPTHRWEQPQSALLQQLLGLPGWHSTHVSSHAELMRQLHLKLAINCCINPLTAVLGCLNGQLAEQAHTRWEGCPAAWACAMHHP